MSQDDDIFKVAEDSDISKSAKLSSHILRYKGISSEGLNSFLKVYHSHYVSESKLDEGRVEWLNDFVKSLAELFLMAKDEGIKIRRERDKLSKELEKLRAAPPVDPNATASTSGTDIGQQVFGEQFADGIEPNNSWHLPNVQQINLSNLVKKPRYFNGQRPLPREWIEEYRDAMDDNFWSEQTAIYYFKHFLVDDAAVWFKLSVRPKIRSDWCWDNLYSLFESNYLGRAEKDRIKLLLKELKMKPDDRAANFIPRVRQYLLMLSPNMSEADQVSNISEKLRPGYAMAVVDKDPPTVEELRDVCRKVEAAWDIKKAASESDKPIKTKTFTKPASRVESRPAVKNNSKRTCHRCGRNNHLVRDCGAKTHINGNVLTDKPNHRFKPASNINTVQVGNNKDEETANEHSDKEVEVTCNTIIASTATDEKRKNWLYVDLNCNNKLCSAVADTGAEKCVISEATVREHGWRIIPHPKLNLSGPNKNAIDIVGTVIIDTKITIGNITKRKKHRWFVAKELVTPMLMGADLIIEFNLICDLARKKVYFHCEQGFRTIKEEYIPANSQKVLSTSINAEGLIMTVHYNRSDKLSVANSISLANNQQAEVLVMNPTNKPIKLKTNTKLANYEIIDTQQPETISTTGPGLTIGAMMQLPNSLNMVNIGDNLEPHQVNDIKQLLNKYAQAFSLKGELGCAQGIKHKIELIDNARPVVEPARRRPQMHVQEAEQQVQDMLKKKIIEESDSPWASAYVVVKKKTGDFRICIDFRRLNAMTKKNAYPLPNIESCLDALAGKKYFSNFDFCSGYWQMEVEEESREYTAFRTEHGHYQFVRMPFGLCNAPASFQKLVNAKFAKLRGLNLQVYLDDVCFASFTWPEHKEALEEFFIVVIDSNIKLNAAKCTLGAMSIKFLGHIISADGIKQDPAKMAAMLQLPRPRNVHEVRRIVGMLNYYRRFVPNFAQLSTPLTNLTRKKATFKWSEEEETALNSLLSSLCDNATLTHFNNYDNVLLKTDASKNGIGGILMQKQNGEWKIVCCFSRKLNTAESNYGITHLEGLAVVDSMMRFRPYLIGRHFELLTDHSALKVLAERESKNQRIKRWQILLSEFDFSVTHIKGALHADVDCISRSPVNDCNDFLLDDKICTILIPLDIENWTYESEEDILILEKAVKEEDSLLVKEDLVYKNNKLYVPTAHRITIMKEAHDSVRGGHGGQQVTLAKLFQFWWSTIIADVISYVKGCVPCQQRKVERALPVSGNLSFEAYSPFECVAIDTLGPLPETLSGYRYVIIAVDVFTRFIEARAIKDVKAQDCASFIVEMFGRHGPPTRIISDNGPQFLNDLVRDTLAIFGVQQRWSIADHSQGNAPAERAIQTFQEKLSLSCLSGREIDSWDSIIPTITLAINSSISKSTGYSPFEMLFGREPIIFDNVISRKSSPKDLHTQLIKARLDKIYNRAIDSQDNAKENARQRFNNNYRERSYIVGDKVLMRDPNRRKGKLDSRFDGPFRVSAIKNSHTYEITNLKTGKKYVRHSGSLKPFFARPMDQASSNNQASSDHQTPSSSNHSYATRANAPRRNISMLYTSLLILMLTSHYSLAIFQREPNQMWLWEDKQVFGQFIEFDIQAIISSPCKSLQIESERYTHTKIEAHYETHHSEAQDLHTEFQHKCDKYDRDIFDVALNELVKTCSAIKQEDNISKRGLIGYIMGGFSGCVIMDLVTTVWDYVNPNSDYNRLNRVEAQVDQLEQKHAHELNAFKNITKSFIQTFNATITTMKENKANIHQLITDLPEYVFGASFLLDYILRGSHLLDELKYTCLSGKVNFNALAEFLQLPKLREFDPRDSKWLSITSVRPGAVRFRFQVAQASKDSHIHGVSAFDVWDFSKRPYALKKYNGPSTMLVNRTSDCARGIEKPEEHMVSIKCNTRNYVDPNLKKWTVIRESNDLRKEQQVTQIKHSSNSIWIYCPFGNITIEGSAVPCPPYVFSVPMGTAFSTSDFEEPGMMREKTTAIKAIDEKLTAHFVHALTDDSFDLVESLTKLESAANNLETIIPINNNSNTNQWVFLLSLVVAMHLLGMATLYLVQNYKPTTLTTNPEITMTVIDDPKPKPSSSSIYSQPKIIIANVPNV